MTLKKTILATGLAAALSLAATQALAAPACYAPHEFEAEQGLRIHSELMVIGLTCVKMPGQSNIYGKYQAFTAKNEKLIAKYESDLIAHFRMQGGGNPEKQFHSLRTGLANRISQLAIGNMVGFCRSFTPRMDAALAMDQPRLRQWAQQVWAEAPTSKPLCTRPR